MVIKFQLRMSLGLPLIPFCLIDVVGYIYFATLNFLGLCIDSIIDNLYTNIIFVSFNFLVTLFLIVDYGYYFIGTSVISIR